MADRKKTPDILGSLLGDTIKPEYHNTGIPEYQNTSKPELQPTIKPVSQSTSKPVRKPTSKPAGQKKAETKEPAKKVKATFYLDAEIVEALETGWMELRRLADKKDRGQISKSMMVELALQLALEGLKAQGVNSLLAKNCRKLQE
jgi:hypothetical protein